MPYVQTYACARCGHAMSWRTKMHSMGVCPYCGLNNKGTVCNTTEESVWVEPRKPWTAAKVATFIGVGILFFAALGALWIWTA